MSVSVAVQPARLATTAMWWHRKISELLPHEQEAKVSSAGCLRPSSHRTGGVSHCEALVAKWEIRVPSFEAAEEGEVFRRVDYGRYHMTTSRS